MQAAPTRVVVPDIHQPVASSVMGPRVRVADHYQKPNLVASAVYAAPTLSVPTTPTGVTHAHVASRSAGVTYTPTTLMPIAPTTVSCNPVGTSASYVKLPKLNMKRFSGDLTTF